MLQDGEYEPLGSKDVRKVDVRIIAATNRDLRREMDEGLRKSLGDPGPPPLGPKGALNQDLQSVERFRILRALQESGWKVKGDGNAASRLGLKPSTLQSRIKRLGIERP